MFRKKTVKPVIGVTGNSRYFSPSWWFIKIALTLLGAKAIRISVRHQSCEKNIIEGLIISGGDDINPNLYNGNTCDSKAKIDYKRDKLEIEWIKWAADNNVPLLGICRGAQLINVVFGGTLHQDITLMRKLTHNRSSILATKLVTLDSDSKLIKLIRKSNIRVNSLHHQAIHKTGKNLKVVAYDKDNIIQAIESINSHIIFGVQWHPEYLFYLSNHRKIFKLLTHRIKST